MRQIVLDTETTGLEWKKGNRVVEIGCVELVERRPTGRTYHQYIKPDRDFEQGAAEVTGLSLEFLADKPPFADIADAFLEFIEGAELIIHNAAFDVGFLDNELSLLGPHYGTLRQRVTVEDSLLLARQRYPGQRNSLDALCDRFGVDRSNRTFHGAKLDAQLLADVYINLTRGQDALLIDAAADEPTHGVVVAVDLRRFALPVIAPAEDELAAHEELLAQLDKSSKGKTLFRRLEPQA